MCVSATGDEQGLFPTSLYTQFDWSMRQYYFSDHVTNAPSPSSYPVWLPLSPFRIHEDLLYGEKEVPNQKRRNVLLLAVVPDVNDTSSQNVICERGTAEQDNAQQAKSSSRCYKSWQRKEILQAMKKIQQWSGSAIGNAHFRVQVISITDPTLLTWIRRSIFVVAPSEHVCIGSESRIMWTAFENGAIPVVIGPAHQLGLPEFGIDHPVPELRPDSIEQGLLNMMHPFFFLPIFANASESRNSSGSNGSDPTAIFNLDLEIHTASRDRALVRLQRRVAKFYKKLHQQLKCRHIFDHTQPAPPLPPLQPQKQPFQHLLDSYRYWNKYHHHPLATSNGTSLEHSYRSALRAVDQCIAPSPLRIFALENLAAVEHIEAITQQQQGRLGWQTNNRRSLVTISEALRTTLSFCSERMLFPWLPKLLFSASALTWNLGAMRSAEQFTQEALRYNPLSVQYLSQLIEIWQQMKDRGGGDASVGGGTLVPSDGNAGDTWSNDPIVQVARYAHLLHNISGYKDQNWSVANLHVVAKWWRVQELKFRASPAQEQEKKGKEHSPLVEMSSTVMLPGLGAAARKTEESIVVEIKSLLAHEIVPMEKGDKDAVDELLWLLDREDTSPLLLLLEMGEAGS